MSRCLALSLVLLLSGCPKDPQLSKPDPPDTAPDTGSDSHSATDLVLSTEIQDGSSGTIILRFAPVAEGAEPQEFTLAAGDTLETDLLPAGDYGLLAWLDEDSDGSWDGRWTGEGEPSARLGLQVPDELHLVLRRGVAEPILDEDPELVELYHAAWDLAEEHVQAGTTANGFAEHYMDEAFSEQIFQWDTYFMVLFGQHGLDAFPVMASLDNFYGIQQDDGYICRVANEWDGEPGGDASDPTEPMINPPLFAWAELRYVQRSGDLSRLPAALPVLEAYADWLDGNVRTGPGLYYTSMLGSGMDNAPRDAAYDGWVDITAQQAQARAILAELYGLLGEDDQAADALGEQERICEDLREQMWDDDEGWFFDLGQDSAYLEDKTLASVWPLLADCATGEQAARVVDHLQDPSEFWRVHVFPSTAADSDDYDAYGHYWRGGVWAPTTYATVQALSAVGRRDLARAAADNHLRNLLQVYTDFSPDGDDLAKDHEGDGTGTLWELYAPDHVRPGTRWDATWLGRQDFVGWTGLGPIALLLEQIIGLEADAGSDTLHLYLQRSDRHGVEGYRFGDQLLDLVVQARSGPEAQANIELSSSDDFTLVVHTAGSSWSFSVPAGDSSFELDPSESVLAAATVTAGPFPGYAVLGNGSISAVYSDDDGSGDPPGILHLYRDDFATDLLELGQTLVGQDGQRVTQRRVGLDPFFAAYTELPLPDGGSLAWRSFVGSHSAVIIQGALLAPADSASSASLAPLVQLREQVHMDGTLSWSDPRLDEDQSALWAKLSDGTALALGVSPAPSSWQAGWISVDPVVDGLSGAIEEGRQLVLRADLEAQAGSQASFTWVLALGEDPDEALALVEELLAEPDPLATAEQHWADWAPELLCSGELCELAAANLYAARASSLAGQVPADLTGQFVTDDRPQLYPRDALMVGRVFARTGHLDEAWEILRYWLSPQREQPQPGEYYARYDALGRGVDGGSGAAYDLPEWDSNGYLASLAELLGSADLDDDERDELLDALDFLVLMQDDDGLWTEGGIIEWEGRLPATTMSSWVGLDAGARSADSWGEAARAEDYRAAAGSLRGGLLQLWEWDGLYLADERDGALAYDSSLLLGPAWGFPPDPVLDSSWAWLMDNARAHGGGVRYFEGMDYGQDLFGFTTAASAQHAATIGDTWTAWELLEWMAAFTNRYGLFPERIYADGTGAAEASPLSWCAAETAMAILRLEQVQALPATPSVDGELDPAEYRAWGSSALDRDGAGDGVDDLVALFAARDDAQLYLALQLAGPTDDAPADSSWIVHLAGEDGQGASTHTDGGLPLSFRSSPGTQPGASASVELTATACGGCAEYAPGSSALEARVDLAALGLDGAPVQLIAQRAAADGESLLPAHGALQSDGESETVLVTFEVDAAAVAHELDGSSTVTLSGDRAELGAWTGHAVELFDDGLGLDLLAGDGLWTATVQLERGGSVAYKYLLGDPDDASWDGVEFEGDDRALPVEDIDGSGRVRSGDVFGEPGGALQDP